MWIRTRQELENRHQRQKRRKVEGWHDHKTKQQSLEQEGELDPFSLAIKSDDKSRSPHFTQPERKGVKWWIVHFI
ncbi:hypothetical protein NCCP2331_34960 [Sporosarcina sp. NCCP-2331]|nr:hypothetical protein NCCP2331_34960 [Sporosarcina sp. NCCP-2331]GLB57699.1 hypothetical protein NCCP2378_34890 [Sporosarcina sp. NCCP-2378]